MDLNSLVSRSMHRVLRVAMPMAALFFAAAFAGCSGSPGTGSTDMSGTAADMAVISRYGVVRMASTIAMSAGQTSYSSSATALFLDTSQLGSGCQRQVSGQCMLYSCSSSSVSLPTAGNITLSGATQAIPPLTPRLDGSYNPYADTSNAVFAPGQALSVDGAGMPSPGVPVFHGAVTPPGGTFVLTNPDGSNPNIVFNLNRHQDFQVVWTALAPGSRVHVELNQDTDTSRGLFLECDYDGASGQGVIPAALSGSFQVTNGQLHVGGLFVGPSASSEVKTGGWDIAVIAISNGRAAFANITDS